MNHEILLNQVQLVVINTLIMVLFQDWTNNIVFERRNIQRQMEYLPFYLPRHIVTEQRSPYGVSRGYYNMKLEYKKITV